VLKKVEITVPSNAVFIVSLAAPELIYSWCSRLIARSRIMGFVLAGKPSK
jgi:hypothetical protein